MAVIYDGRITGIAYILGKTALCPIGIKLGKKPPSWCFWFIPGHIGDNP